MNLLYAETVIGRINNPIWEFGRGHADFIPAESHEDSSRQLINEVVERLKARGELDFLSEELSDEEFEFSKTVEALILKVESIPKYLEHDCWTIVRDDGKAFPVTFLSIYHGKIFWGDVL